MPFFITEGKSVTVCMLGLVPVNAIGSVQPGEALYASPDHPGTARSEFYLTETNEERKPALVGHAFQQVDCRDDQVIKFCCIKK